MIGLPEKKGEGVKLHFFHFHSLLRRIRWAYFYLTLSREIKKDNQSGNPGRGIGINKLLKNGFSIRIWLRDKLNPFINDSMKNLVSMF